MWAALKGRGVSVATTRIIPLHMGKGLTMGTAVFRPGEITPEDTNRLGVEFAKRFTKVNHAFLP